MEQECPAEMIRSPLENVVLKAKLLEMGSPPSILALALNPPNLSDIHSSILMLKEVGALLPKNGKVFGIDDGELTYIGRIMSVLPVEVRVTKLIILGYFFSVMDECIVIGELNNGINKK